MTWGQPDGRVRIRGRVRSTPNRRRCSIGRFGVPPNTKTTVMVTVTPPVTGCHPHCSHRRANRGEPCVALRRSTSSACGCLPWTPPPGHGVPPLSLPPDASRGPHRSRIQRGRNSTSKTTPMEGHPGPAASSDRIEVELRTGKDLRHRLLRSSHSGRSSNQLQRSPSSSSTIHKSEYFWRTRCQGGPRLERPL